MNRSRKKFEEPTVHTKESSLKTRIQELQKQRDELRAEVKRRRQARVSESALWVSWGEGQP